MEAPNFFEPLLKSDHSVGDADVAPYPHRAMPQNCHGWIKVEYIGQALGAKFFSV